jgi:hypothetical protein
MPESNFSGVFVPDKLTLASKLTEAIDDFYDLPSGLLSSGATIKFLPWAWQVFWNPECYLNLSVECSVPGPLRKTTESGAVTDTFQQLVTNNFSCPANIALASLASGKRGWIISWPDNSHINLGPSASAYGPNLKNRTSGSLPSDGIGILGQVKLLGALDDPNAVPPSEGSYLMVGDYTGSGQRVGLSARYVGWVGAGETVKTQMYIDASGDIYLQQTAGPNKGKRVDITKGAWK